MQPCRSKLEFGSLLRYYPGPDRGLEAVRKSLQVNAAIKNDRPIWKGELGPDYLASVFQDRCKGTPLESFVSPNAVLVPLPRAAPHTRGGLWPAMRIALSLVQAGVGKEAAGLIVRSQPIASASRDGGKRMPALHMETCKVADVGLVYPDNIVLVDDIVGSGATALGISWLLDKALPRAKVKLLAVSRVVQVETPEVTLLDPVVGVIRYNSTNHSARRDP